MPMIGEGVRKGLRQDGFAVDWVRDGQAAEAAAANGVYDLVCSISACRARTGSKCSRACARKGSTVPVLILTARDAVADRIKGLDSGADDYLVKPFDLDELCARIRALLRRRAGRADAVIEHGELRVDASTRQATFRGRDLALSAREFAVLEALLERPGAILSRAQIEERLYGWGEEVESNAVEVYIHSLRRKLGADFIRNVRGVGYRVPKRP